MRILASICVTTAIGLGSFASAGTVTSFSSEALYDAAIVGDLGTVNFDGFASGNSDGNFGIVDFNTIGGTNPDLITHGTDSITDAGDPSTALGVGVLQGVLAAPTTAFALEVLSGSIQGVNLFDGSGLLVGSISGTFSGFFGVVADMEFERFDFVPSVFDAIAVNAFDRVFVDNFRLSSTAAITTPLPPVTDPTPTTPTNPPPGTPPVVGLTPVPLPGSLFLLAGALGFGGVVVQRKKAARKSVAA